MAFIKQHQIAHQIDGETLAQRLLGVSSKPAYRDALETIEKTKPRRAAEKTRGRALLPSITCRARLGSVLAGASQGLPGRAAMADRYCPLRPVNRAKLITCKCPPACVNRGSSNHSASSEPLRRLPGTIDTIRSRELGSDLEDPSPDPASQAEQRQLLLLLRAMAAALPAAYRDIYELRYGRDLSNAETARRLGISPSNAATRLDRAVGMLRSRLDARLHRK